MKNKRSRFLMTAAVFGFLAAPSMADMAKHFFMPVLPPAIQRHFTLRPSVLREDRFHSVVEEIDADVRRILYAATQV